jgi:hypothetical protein
MNTPSHPLSLPALTNHYFPWSYLAALGVLAVLTRHANPDESIALHWELQQPGSPVYQAVLTAPFPMTEVYSRIYQAANTYHPDLPDPTMIEEGLPNIPASWLHATLKALAPTDIETAYQWQGLIMEGADTANLSALHLLSGGQHKFFFAFVLAAAQQTIARQTDSSSLKEALIGPWRFQDHVAPKTSKGCDALTFGWLAHERREWVYQASSPEKQTKTTVAAIIWLAAEGFTAFPLHINEQAQAITTGVREGRPATLTLPLWDTPLTLTASRYLLWSSPHHSDRTWNRRGITALLQSSRYPAGKKHNAWYPPTPI